MDNLLELIKTKKVYYLVAIIVLVVIIILLLVTIKDRDEQALVKRGIIENTEVTIGYIIKNEAVIAKDSTKVLVPVVSENEKVAKDSIIATYKGADYANYKETLAALDKEIFEQMKSLPAVYSSEVDAIDGMIHELIKKSIGENSYGKMEEYSNKINSNINKRATIIGNLSPDGAEIKKLIAKRNEYEEEAKKSNDNIIAPMTGIVSYKTDGLETKLKLSDIDKISCSDIKELIKSNAMANNNEIKVVNNYEAYIIVESDLAYYNYMEAGTIYRIRLADNNYELRATLENVKKLQDKVEVCFKITNGIENLIDARTVQIEIIWDWDQGLYIPLTTVSNDDNNKNLNYVTAIKYAENVNIPIKLGTRNDSFVIVSNYSYDELEELNIECDYRLVLHDRLLINKNK